MHNFLLLLTMGSHAICDSQVFDPEVRGHASLLQVVQKVGAVLVAQGHYASAEVTAPLLMQSFFRIFVDRAFCVADCTNVVRTGR
jgi:hypothetical protein